MATAEATGAPAVTALVVPVGIVTAQTIGIATVAGEVDPAALASTEDFGQVQVGASGITGAGAIASAELFGALQVDGSSAPSTNVSGGGGAGYTFKFRSWAPEPAAVAPIERAGGIASQEAIGRPWIGAVVLSLASPGAAQVGSATVRRGPILQDEEFLLLAA